MVLKSFNLESLLGTKTLSPEGLQNLLQLSGLPDLVDETPEDMQIHKTSNYLFRLIFLNRNDSKCRILGRLNPPRALSLQLCNSRWLAWMSSSNLILTSMSSFNSSVLKMLPSLCMCDHPRCNKTTGVVRIRHQTVTAVYLNRDLEIL